MACGDFACESCFCNVICCSYPFSLPLFSYIGFYLSSQFCSINSLLLGSCTCICHQPFVDVSQICHVIKWKESFVGAMVFIEPCYTRILRGLLLINITYDELWVGSILSWDTCLDMETALACIYNSVCILLPLSACWDRLYVPTLVPFAENLAIFNKNTFNTS